MQEEILKLLSEYKETETLMIKYINLLNDKEYFILDVSSLACLEYIEMLYQKLSAYGFYHTAAAGTRIAPENNLKTNCAQLAWAHSCCPHPRICDTLS